MAKSYNVNVQCPYCSLECRKELQGLEGSKIIECKGVMSKRGCGELFAVRWRHEPIIEVFKVEVNDA